MTRTMAFLAAATLMFGCGNDDDGSASDSGTTTGGELCQEVLEFFPTEGDSAVYYRTTVEFTFDSVDGTEALEPGRQCCTDPRVQQVAAWRSIHRVFHRLLENLVLEHDGETR